VLGSVGRKLRLPHLKFQKIFEYKQRISGSRNCHANYFHGLIQLTSAAKREEGRRRNDEETNRNKSITG
jgi:hypothetical protein